MKKKNKLSLAKLKYSRHKALAKYRNIDFLISFSEWYNWWLIQGIDKNVVTYTKQDIDRLCMCRINDTGPYAIDNIYCDTSAKNSSFALKKRNNYKELYFDLKKKYDLLIRRKTK